MVPFLHFKLYGGVRLSTKRNMRETHSAGSSFSVVQHAFDLSLCSHLENMETQRQRPAERNTLQSVNGHPANVKGLS